MPPKIFNVEARPPPAERTAVGHDHGRMLQCAGSRCRRTASCANFRAGSAELQREATAANWSRNHRRWRASAVENGRRRRRRRATSQHALQRAVLLRIRKVAALARPAICSCALVRLRCSPSATSRCTTRTLTPPRRAAASLVAVYCFIVSITMVLGGTACRRRDREKGAAGARRLRAPRRLSETTARARRRADVSRRSGQRGPVRSCPKCPRGSRCVRCGRRRCGRAVPARRRGGRLRCALRERITRLPRSCTSYPCGGAVPRGARAGAGGRGERRSDASVHR